MAVTKALVQFLLFSQVLAAASVGGSQASGSVSVSSTARGTPSVQPSVPPTSTTNGAGSVSPTSRKTSSASASVRPSTWASTSVGVSTPSSIQVSSSSSTRSASLQPSSIPTGRSSSASQPISTPSKAPVSSASSSVTSSASQAPSVRPSSSPSKPSSSPSASPSRPAGSSTRAGTPGSSASQTPSARPSSIQSITPSKASSQASSPSQRPSSQPSGTPSARPSTPVSVSSRSSTPSGSASRPDSTTSRASSAPSQASRSVSGGTSPSVSPSKPSSIVSSASPSRSASASSSKPVSGTASRSASSNPSKPVSGSQSASGVPSGSASKSQSRSPSASASRSSSFQSSRSGVNTPSASRSASTASPSGPSGSSSSTVSRPISSPSRMASNSVPNGSGSQSASRSTASGGVSSSRSANPSGSVSSGRASFPSGTRPNTNASGSQTRPVGSGSQGPTTRVSASGSATGPRPPVNSSSSSSGASTGPSGGVTGSRPTTSASGSGSVPLNSGSSSSRPQSPGQSGSATIPRPSDTPGSGSQPLNTRTTGPAASGTNSGPSTSGQSTRIGASGSSGALGGTQSSRSNGGQPQPSGSNGSPSGGSGASGSARPTTSMAGPVGGSGSSSSASATGGNGGSGACPTTCPSSCPTTAVGPTATLGCGVIRGTTTSLYAATATVNKFLGVPFAQSPPRRFSPPQTGASCDVDATAFKPACIQQFVYPKIRQDFVKLVFNNPGGTPPEESEDCLYLNVYAPSSPPPADGRAVMFWIYGGALQFGTAGIPYYDGSYFAAYEDVIVVTTNYRTNVFGFATSPEIPVSQRNLGFLDQRAALDWVQENIAAFGGSPDKVTIFGESAGGFSVDALLTSYGANSTPPFRGAIMESGQISYNAQSRPSTVPQWNQLAGLLGCPGNYTSNLACLRAANASAIKNAIEVNVLTFNPVADGVTLATNSMQKRLSGNIPRIPVLEGTNAQEGRVFALGQSNTTEYLTTLLGNNTAAIQTLEAAYPLNSTGISTQYDQSAQIFTELVFQCAAAYHANASASVGIPAWRYYYNASFTNTQAFPGLGVYHASEIPLVFSTYPRDNVTVQEYALSRTMRSIWASFAKNPAAGPGWNPVGTGTDASVLVGASGLGEGGIYLGENGTMTRGAYDLGVLGNRENVLGSGVTIIDSSEVDSRCGLYRETYQRNAQAGA